VNDGAKGNAHNQARQSKKPALTGARLKAAANDYRFTRP
jgi:hypothetical protein